MRADAEDAETHTQTLGRARGTLKKREGKCLRSQRGGGFPQNTAHRIINLAGLTGYRETDTTVIDHVWF